MSPFDEGRGAPEQERTPYPEDSTEYWQFRCGQSFRLGWDSGVKTVVSLYEETSLELLKEIPGPEGDELKAYAASVLAQFIIGVRQGLRNAL